MKGQSLIYQFVLFFLIGFTIFLAVGNLFRTHSDMFKEDVATLSAKLTNSYLSSIVVTSVSTCKQCDYVSISLKIPETYAGQYQEMSMSSRGINVSAQNKYSSSPLHNLNSTFTLSGKSSSAMSKWVPEKIYTITTFSDDSSAKNITFDATLNPRYYEHENAASNSFEGACGNPENAYDGNWDTYAQASVGLICHIYENYSILDRNTLKHVDITYKLQKGETNEEWSLWIFNHTSNNWVRAVYYPTGNYTPSTTSTFIIEGKDLKDFVSIDGKLSYYVKLVGGEVSYYYESKIGVEYDYPSIKIPKNANITFISATMNISGYAYFIEEDDTEDSWKCEMRDGGPCPYRIRSLSPQNTVDENWTSYYGGDMLMRLYVNYSTPSKVSKVEWKLKVYKTGIPSTVSCYNSTTWKPIGTYITRGDVVNVTFKLDDKCLTNPIQLRTIISSDGFPGGVFEEMIVLHRFFPTNPSLDVANDGIKEWSITGELNSTNSPQTVGLSTTTIQNFLSRCRVDAEGYCLVPLNMSSDSEGIVESNNLKIDYYIGALKKIDKPITLTYNKNKNKVEVS